MDSLPPPLPPPAPLRPERSFPWGRVVLGCVAAVVVAAVAVPLKWRFNLRREVKRELELCRAAGQAVTLEELAALYRPVPDGENAALPLLEIWREDDPAFWDAWQEGRKPLPESLDLGIPQLAGEGRPLARGQPPKPQDRAVHDVWWRSNEVRMARVQAALRRPDFRFPMRFEDGHQMLLPHLRAMKAEAQRLRLRALFAAEAGDTEAALSAIEAGGATARLLEAEPVLISQLVVLANRAITMRAVEDFLNRQAPTTAGLDRLAGAVAWSPVGDGLARGFQSERAMALDLLSMPAGRAAEVMQSLGKTSREEADADSPWVRLGLLLTRLQGTWEEDRLNLLRTWRRAVAASEATAANRAAYHAAFDDAAEAVEEEPRLIFSRMFLPALRKVWDKFARVEAEAGMAQVAFAVERFRLRHGQPPASADELIPEFLAALPADPFADGPLRYRRLDHGYVVYSVGDDGSDDGGQPVKSGGTKFLSPGEILEKYGVAVTETPRQDAPARMRDIAFTVERDDLARPGAPSFVRGGVPATSAIPEEAGAGQGSE